MFKFSYPNKQELIGSLLQTKKDYNLTNDYLAKEIGVSPITMSSWLNFKSAPANKYQEKIEDFIAKIWQPGIVCVWNNTQSRKGHFFLVGSIYDPFFTWIHNYEPETYAEEIAYIESMEAQIKNGEATLHIVKKYVDMDEANKIGRDEEIQYNFGSISCPDGKIHLIRPNGQIDIKPPLFYEPN